MSPGSGLPAAMSASGTATGFGQQQLPGGWIARCTDDSRASPQLLDGRRGGGDATSTTPAGPTNAGTPTPRLQHDHNELQPPYQRQPSCPVKDQG